MAQLFCAKCDAREPLPDHCGQPMKVQKQGENSMLVCWMGPECGVQDLPEHCGEAMGLSGEDD